MRPLLRRLAASIPFAAGGLGSGCNRLQEALTDEVQERVDRARETADDASAVPEPPTLSPDEQLARKLELPVGCLDRSRKRLTDAWARYAENVDPIRGTPKRRKTRPFVQAVDDELRPCRDAVARVSEMEPPLPELELALAHYVASAEPLASLTQVLHDYYDRGEYEQDAWTTGKLVAPLFASAWEQWSARAETLETMVDARKDEVDRRLLTVIEEREGQGLRWHTQNLVVRAKAFVGCATEASSDEDCGAPFGELRQAEQGFRGYHDAHPDDARAVFWMSAFEARVADFFEQAEVVHRALQRRRKAEVERELERLGTQHRDLTAAASNLRFDFPAEMR